MIQKNPLIYLSRKMWHYAQGNRRNVVLYVCMFFLSSALVALQPLIVGNILNQIQLQGVHAENLGNLALLLLLLPSLEIVFWLLHGPARMIENRNAFFVRAQYTNSMLKGVMGMPLEWHVDHHSGDTIDKIEKGTNALFSFAETTFDVLYGIITLILASTILLIYDPVVGVLVLGFSTVIFLGLLAFDKRLIPGYKRVNTMENTTSAKIYDALSNITTIVILRVERLVLGTLNTFIQKPFEQYNKNNKINEFKWFFAAFGGRTAVATVIIIYMYFHASEGTILAGTVYILYGYTDQIRSSFFKFANLYNNIVKQRAQVANAEEISKEFRTSDAQKTKRMPENWEELEINNLAFSYHTVEGADLHIDNLSMSLRRGERIALIGESGGGKSTFLKLLRDLYHPRTLELRLDGRKLSRGFASISDSISLVPQDPEIFATTIRENITLGVEYSESHIKVFTDLAAFTEVAARLPHGLESSIVEKGVNFSGGEKQRLALARGLLASENKDIILLDEPTSSVDFHNELAIYKNIFNSFPRSTIISSIHRLHLLSLFDTIYLFSDGKIATYGTFENLKQNSPEFQRLWEKYISTRDVTG
ncbi:MAG TPA: ABC transporter ATP-binding protein [Patescibacteria group bacterium]|nr:ABC transporter ATP-binding protein [Patescibacteria group bacterium]